MEGWRGGRPVALRVRAAGDSRDPELCAEAARAYREDGVTVVPTLVVSARDRSSTLVSDSVRMALLPPGIRDRWMRMADSGSGPIAEVMREGEWTAPKNTRLLHEAGVRILAGTDLGNPFLIPGSSLHDELELLVYEAGLSPLDATRRRNHTSGFDRQERIAKPSERASDLSVIRR